MDTTKAQQKALDDALVAPENLALNALKLTPFYNTFEVSVDVLEIYMQEFWATVTKHHFSLRFKMNGKIHTVNVDNFIDMLKIFPKLPDQKFEDPPFKEEILSFIRDLGHTSEIKVLSDVNVNHLHQPWRSFAECLSGKTTTLESLQVTSSNPLGNKKVESSPKTKPTQASKGKRIKTSSKGVIPAKKKQSATKSKGLAVLSDVALTEAEQMKIALKRSKTQQHNSHASGLSADEGTGVTPGFPDVPSYDSKAEQISWKSSDKEDDDEVNMGNDNDANVEGEEMDEEETNEEDEANELYRDVNVNLEGRDTEMTDAPRTIIQTTQVIEDTHVIITPVNSEAQPQSSFVSFGFVSNMLNLVQIQPPLLSTTTLPPPTTPLITHLQQTPIPTPATAPSSSLQDLPNFGSLFGFDHRLRTLEIDFSELKQTNQFDAAVSSIPGTVDAYLANKMHEAVKIAV
ncbi:hypothetical protein Tco_0117180 [Tanacetum coccineum]